MSRKARRNKKRRIRKGLGGLACATVMTGAAAGPADAAVSLVQSDLQFVMDQIEISEAHSAGGQLLGTGPNQISNPLFSYGLRTVDGSENNLIAGQGKWGAADILFPRIANPLFRPADPRTIDPDGPGPGRIGEPTTYAATNGIVEDTAPRRISNLIADQTDNNPAAVAARERTPGSSKSDHDANAATPDLNVIPNQTPDVALSAPYNSWFTLFGQFFDHGLDLTTKGSSGTVMVPLQADDPLLVGPDGEAGTADDPSTPLPVEQRFMVLTRATNQPGPDGRLGTADDIREHTNTTTSYVDQNQTYTSHPAHQVFLRDYVRNADGRTVSSGRLLDLTPDKGGVANWTQVKAQAHELLGIELRDSDVLNVPLVATDPYGRFLPGANGYPQLVMSDNQLVEGDPAANGGKGITTVGAARTNHAFLDDIAHHAVPFGDHDGNPASPRQDLLPDAGTEGTADDNLPGTYDDEMLGAHFITGDGRGNENIGLTTVHHMFHSEHNRMTDHIKDVLVKGVKDGDVAFLNQWLTSPVAAVPEDLSTLVWNGERIFQAARFVTEMQYQHLVFEEFARKVQPQVNLFAGYDTDVNASITSEFANTVYRFGHSMLTEKVDRVNADGSTNDIGLIQAFLNPLEFRNGGGAGELTPDKAAGAIARGMTRQRGNEIDEFVTDALRTNLLGLPLDLAALNMMRGRETGIPSLNQARRKFYAMTTNSALEPYVSWADFKTGIRHPESLVNFVAAYGTHETVLNATTMKAKRAAAALLVLGGEGAPEDRLDFLKSQGAWANDANGVTRTGLEDVDFWMGGLAEKQMPFGGLLGSSFNFVFETQMEKLQDGDRLYYLARTAGLNMLTELEANSFSELVMANTDLKHLPADSFSTPDEMYELETLGATSDPIPDDPATASDESELTRMNDGTVRYIGGGHVVMGGTDGADRMRVDEGDDTVWGDGGADRMEGGAGVDALHGDDGDDIITDAFGDDVIKGGNGNDAISAGAGLDLVLSGKGDDFDVLGSDPGEVFASGGDDYILGGDSSDTIFANEGDDWIEGGGQADLLQGGNGAPFQDDKVTGNDVIIGGGGNDDYDSEGGDDVMVTGPGIERNEGMQGFDWVTHKGDPQAANADMDFSGFSPPDEDNVRDRFDSVEGLSGWNKDDVLRGDDLVAADQVDNRLENEAQINVFGGLGGLLGAGVTEWDGGNIILGGAGSDTIEGRGGDDIIDGDKWLDVQIQAPDVINGGTKRVDSMKDVQADVLSGKVNPGQLETVREIKAAAPGTDVDTAVFSGPRADYDIVPNLNRTRMTITHARGTATDGIDSVRNVERLQFADQTITIQPVASLSPNRTFAARLVGSTSAAQAVTLSNTGNAPLTIDDVALAGDNPGDFAIATNACGTTLAAGASCNIGITFRPTALGARSAILRVTDDSDNVAGSTQEVTLSGTGNNNRPATGSVLVSDRAPQVGQTLTAITTSIADADGLGTFRFQWQRTPQDGSLTWSNVPGNGTSASFTIPGGVAGALTNTGRRYRVIVSFTDGAGNAEELTSNATERTTAIPNTTTGPTAPVTTPPPAAPQALVAPGPAPADPAVAGAAALRLTAVTVTARVAAPITVAADVPSGTSTVSIRVFRTKGRNRGGRTAVVHRGRKLVAKIYRTVEGGRRHTFRLTDKPLRRLPAGRYIVEVRAGTSRTDLGPATTRTIRIKKGKGTA